jgi:hypothetical protein
MMMDSNSLKLSFYKESICSEFVIFYDILQDVHKALTLILYTKGQLSKSSRYSSACSRVSAGIPDWRRAISASGREST